MSTLAASIIAVLTAVGVLTGLGCFAVWEHRRHNEREAQLKAAVEAAKHCPVTDEVDDVYRSAVTTFWGPTPSVGIYNCPEHTTPGGSTWN